MSGRDPVHFLAGMPVTVGELAALGDDGTPFVLDRRGGSAVVRPARTVVDLQGSQVGHAVVVMYEAGDPERGIVLGVVRDGDERPADLEVRADGERMVVSAKRQLVLRCGRASITLASSGKVVINGAYVLSHSTGVNRIQGGSVQLN